MPGVFLIFSDLLSERRLLKLNSMFLSTLRSRELLLIILRTPKEINNSSMTISVVLMD